MLLSLKKLLFAAFSYNDFMSEMEPFVEWKNRKGIPTEMVSVSSIGSSSSAIENYVDDYYHDNGLTYLLLVGDIAQIPSPTLSGSASDPSYGFIDGNDYYSEILVGRFSGNNPAEWATYNNTFARYVSIKEEQAQKRKRDTEKKGKLFGSTFFSITFVFFHKIEHGL